MDNQEKKLMELIKDKLETTNSRLYDGMINTEETQQSIEETIQLISSLLSYNDGVFTDLNRIIEQEYNGTNNLIEKE